MPRLVAAALAAAALGLAAPAAHADCLSYAPPTLEVTKSIPPQVTYTGGHVHVEPGDCLKR